MTADTPSADGQREQRASAWAAWLSLAAGSSTLICCALPALLVALGAGAALSSLVAVLPQIVWLSEHKAAVFSTATAMMAVAGTLQWRNRHAPCPLEPALREACMRTRRWSWRLWGLSLALLAIGAWFAFVMPWLAGADA